MTSSDDTNVFSVAGDPDFRNFKDVSGLSNKMVLLSQQNCLKPATCLDALYLYYTIMSDKYNMKLIIQIYKFLFPYWHLESSSFELGRKLLGR